MTTNYVSLETELLTWFNQAKSQDFSISESCFTEKAITFEEQLNI